MSTLVHPRYVVDEQGRKLEVILSVAEFEDLMAQLEALQDDDYVADVAALERAAGSETQSKPWRQVRDEIEARAGSRV